MLLAMLSCETELKLHTKVVATDCNQFETDSKMKTDCLATQGQPIIDEEVEDLFGLSIITGTFITNQLEFTLAWEKDDEATGYLLSLAKDSSCSDSVLDYMQFDTFKTMGVVNDGLYHICVYSLRSGSSEVPYDNNGIPFTVDRAKPAIDKSVVFPSSLNSAVEFEAKVSDATDLSFRWQQYEGPGTLTFTPRDQPQLSIDYDEPGIYVAEMIVTDAAGNIQIQKHTFEARPKGGDLSASSGSISLAGDALYHQGSEVAIQLDATEAESYRLCGDAAAAGSPCTVVLRSDTPYAASPDPIILPDGNQTVYVQFKDNKGRYSATSSDSIIVDSTLPQPPTIANHPSAYHNSSIIPLTFTRGVEANPDKVLVTMCTSNDCLSGCETIQEVSTSPVNFGPVSDGSYYLCAQERDMVGQLSPQAVSSAAVTIDTTAPAFTGLNLSAEAADGYINIADAALTGPVANHATGENYTGREYKIIGAGDPCDGSSGYGAALPTFDNVSFVHGNSYRICVKLDDGGANVNAYGTSTAFAVDTLAPVFTSLPLSSEAGDGYLNASDANRTTAVPLGVVATDYDAAAYKIIPEGTSCTGDSGYGAMPNHNDGGFVDGNSYDLCVRVTDLAGNAPAYGVSAGSIVVKTTGPTFTSLPLSSEAGDGYLNLGDALLSTAITSGATGSFDTAQYKIIVDGESCDENSGYGGVPNHNDPLLSDGGSFDLCTRLTDDAGNPAVYGASAGVIAVDTTVPSFANLALSTELADNDLSAADFFLGTPTVSAVIGSGYDTATYKIIPGSGSCDGSVGYGGIPSHDDSGFVDGNSYKICVRLTDEAGNPDAYGTSLVFAASNAVPVFTDLALTTEASDGYINAADAALAGPVVTAATGSNFTGAEYKIITDGTSCDGITGYGATLPNYDDSGFVHGNTYRICAKLDDGGSNPNAYGTSEAFEIDTEAPIFGSLPLSTEAGDGYLNSTDAALVTAISAGVTATGYDNAEYKIIADTDPCDGSTGYGAIPTHDDSGFVDANSYDLCVRLTDDAGNPPAYGVSAGSIAVDTTAPVFTALPLSTEAGDGYLTAADALLLTTASPGVTGSGYDTAAYKIIVDGGPCDGTGGYGTLPNHNTAGFTNGGSFDLCVKLTDDAGNTAAYGTSSGAIVVDTGVPSFTSMALSSELNDNSLSASNFLLTTAAASGAVGSGYDAVAYKIIVDGDPCDGSTGYGAMPNLNDVGFVNGNDYRICARLTDTAGNPDAYGTTTAFAADNAVPSFSGMTLTTEASDGYINAADALLTTGVVNGATGANFTGSEYKIIADDALCDGNTGYTTGIPNYDNTGFVHGNSYRICVKLDDGGANPNAYGTSDAFEIDTEVPSFTGLPLSTEAADGYLNIAEAGLVSAISAGVAGSGYDTATYKIIADGDPCDGSSGYSGIPGHNDAGFLDTNSYDLCVKLTDAAGNPAAYGVSTNSIAVDLLAPSFSTLPLSTEASDGYLNAADVLLGTATTSGATGAGFDLAEYKIIPDGATCDGTSGYGSAPNHNDTGFTDTNSFDLCVKLTDAAGNPPAYGVSTGTIAVDSTEPSFTSMALSTELGDASLSAADAALATAAAAAPLAAGFDAATFKIIEDGNPCDGSIGYGVMPLHNDPGFVYGNNYRVCVRLTDNGGNPDAYGTTAAFLANSAVPTFSSLSLTTEAADGYINIADSGLATDVTNAVSGSNFTGSEYKIIADGTLCDGNTGYSTAIPDYNDPGFVDGSTYRICVKLDDGGANPDAYGTSNAFVIDKTAPSFSNLPLSSEASDGYLSIADAGLTTATSSGATGAGFDTAEYKIIADTDNCEGTSGYGTIPNHDDAGFVDTNSYDLCVKLTDDAGNPAAYGVSSGSIVVDTTAPGFASLPLSPEAGDGYLTAADALLGSAVSSGATGTSFDTAAYKIIADGGTCDGATGYGALANHNDAGFTDTNSFDLCVKLSDNASNPAAYGVSTGVVVVDKNVPTFTSMARSAELNDGSLSAADFGLSTDTTPGVVGTGYDGASYKIILASGLCDSNVGYGTIPDHNDVGFIDGNTYRICVRLTDTAGNPDAYGTTDPFTADNAVPTFLGMILTTEAADGYINIADDALTTAVANAATGNNFSGVEYKIIADGNACEGATGYSTSIPNYNDAGFSDGSAYRICAKLDDGGANPNAYGTTNAFVIDTTVPSLSGVTLSTEAGDGALNAADKGLGTVAVASLTGVYDEDDYKIITDGGTCDDTTTMTATSPLHNDAAFTDGNDFQVCVRVSDSAGNTNYLASATIAVDTMAPNIASVTLSAQAGDGYLNAADAGLTTDAVSVSVSGEDTVYYKIIADGANCDGSTSGMTTTIPDHDNGAFVNGSSFDICVKASDNAGNTDAYMRSSGAIAVDTTAPNIASVTLSAEAGDGHLNIADAALTSDAVSASVSGEDNTEYKIIGTGANCDASITSLTTTVPKHNDAGFTNGSSFDICVKATDNAGNPAAYMRSSGDIAVDKTRPTATYSGEPADPSPDANLDVTVGSAVNYQYKLLSGTTDCTGGGYSSSTAVGTKITAAIGADANKKLCIIGGDAAGNWQLEASATAYSWTKSTTPPDPSNLAFTGDADQLDLTWTTGGGNTAGFIVVASATPITFTPVDGTPYDVNDTQGDDTVVYDNSTASFSHTGLNSGVLYYYAVFAYSSSDYYSPKIEDGAITESSASHRFYRLAVSSINRTGSTYQEKLGVAELQFQWSSTWQTNAMTDYTVGTIGGLSATISGDNENGNSQDEAWQAFNGNTGGDNNRYKTGTGLFSSSSPYDAVGADQLLYVTLASNVEITGYIVHGSTHLAYSLDEYRLQYSNDGSAPWYDISGSSASVDAVSGHQVNFTAISASAGTAPVKPGALTATVASGTQIDLSFADGGGDTAEYLVVRGPDGSAPTFNPNDGTTYSTGVNGSDTILAIGAATTINDTGLTAGNTYLYAVYALDANKNYSAASTVSQVLGESHRYWRLRIDSLGGIGGRATVTELEFSIEGSWATNAMTDGGVGTVGGYSVTELYSYQGVGGKAYEAFDGDLGFSSNWLTQGSSFSMFSPHDYSGSPSYLGLDFGTPVSVDGYRHYVDSANYCPDDGELEYSDNGSTWTAVSGSDLDTSCTLNTFVVSYSIGAVATLAGQPANPSNDTALDVTVGGSGVVDYQYDFRTAADCVGVSYGSFISTGTKITDSISGDGTKTLCVKGRDSNSTVQVEPTVYTWVYDGTSPVVNSVATAKADGHYSTGEVIDIDVTFDSTVVVTGIPQLTLDNGAVVDYTSGDGTAVLTFQYTVAGGQTSSDLDYANTSALALNSGSINDEAGNTASLTLDPPVTTGSISFDKAVVIDTTAPSAFALTAPADATQTNDDTPTITWSASSDTNSVSYNLTIHSAPGCASQVQDPTGESASTSYTFVSALSDGTYYSCVTVTDQAGNNTSAPERSFTVDTSAPSFTSLALSATAIDGWINSTELSGAGTLTGTLTASGYTSHQYDLVTSGTDCTAASYDADGVTPSVNGTDLNTEGETYKVCVLLTDTAGNPTYGASATFGLDTLAPTVAAGAPQRARASASLNATTSDGTSGVNTHTWSEPAASGNISFGTGSAADTSVSASADARYVLRLTVTDTAGNSAFDEVEYVRDTTGPAAPAVLHAFPGDMGVRLAWPYGGDDALESFGDEGARDATTSGTPGWTAGEIYGAITLDGTDDRVTLDNQPITQYPFSASLWIKTSTTPASSARIFNLTDTDGNYWIGFNMNASGKFTVGRAGDTVASASTYTDGNWHHVVMVATDETDIKLYVDGNGTAVATNAISYTVNDKTRLNIGGRYDDGGTSGYFFGDIDDFRLYDSALTTAEITNLYNRAPITDIAPVLHYTFDEGSGTSVGHKGVGYLLVRKEGSAVDWSPSDSTSYNVLGGDATNTIIYKGTDQQWYDGARTNMTTYHYKLFAFDGLYNYSEVSIARAEMPRPEIMTASLHNCAQKMGRVRCWGQQGARNGYPSDVDIGDDEHPFEARGIGGSADLNVGGIARKMSTTYQHTCVLTHGGHVRCFGEGGLGQLGYGATTDVMADYLAPVSVLTSYEKASGLEVVELIAGNESTCILTNRGQVRCWGNNVSGTLGLGASTMTGYGGTNNIYGDESGEDPMDLPFVKLGGKAVAIYSQDDGYCALLDIGSPICWGLGDNGRLGQNSLANIADTPGDEPEDYSPIDTGGIVVELASTRYAFCARHTDNTMSCWGRGEQIARASSTTDIGDTETVLSAGNSSLSGFTPTRIMGGVSHHMCATNAAGDLRCWGDLNQYGELGYGSTSEVSNAGAIGAAGNVSVGEAVIAGATGISNTCVLTASGNIRCWGRGSTGQLGLVGTSNIGDDELPSTQPAVKVWRDIRLFGQKHSKCSIKNGKARCWGWNSSGHLGYGHKDNIGDDEEPATQGNVPVGLDVVATAGGGAWNQAANEDEMLCFLTVAGTVRCSGKADSLGYNENGDTNTVGDGVGTALATKGDITLLSAEEKRQGLYAVSLDNSTDPSVCALLSDGATVRCWGKLLYVHGVTNGTIGDDENIYNAAPIAFLDTADLDAGLRIISISKGRDTLYAILSDGSVRAAGNNTRGQLLQGNTTDLTYTTTGNLTLASSAKARQVSGARSIQILTDTYAANNTQAFGGGAEGRHGLSTTADIGDNETIAQVVTMGAEIKQLAAGPNKCCALTTAGMVRCWGNGDNGGLGYGNATTIGDNETPGSVTAGIGGTADVPVVSGAEKVTDIAAAYQSFCAVIDDEKIRCWGNYSRGKLGVPGLSDNVGNAGGQMPPEETIVWNPIWGTPEPTDDGNLSVSVGGDDVVAYVYAAITGDESGCAGASYSSEQPVATDITDSLDRADGQYTICVRTKNSSGVLQAATDASFFTWTKAIADPAVPTSFEPLPGFTADGIDMTAVAGADTEGFVIYRQDSGDGDIAWSPTTDVDYTTATDVTSDTGANASSRIVYAGTSTSFTDQSALEDSKTYLYKIFAYNSNSYREYSSTGVQRLSRTFLYARVETGNKITCATMFGKVRCWGDSQSTGSLGYSTVGSEDVGDDEHPYTMGDVNIGVDVLSVELHSPTYISYQSACALTIEGKARCWGYGSNGRLGTNSTANVAPSSAAPTDVPLGTTIIQLDAGQQHTCALLNTGAVRCWGTGSSGALGTDSTANIGKSGTEIQDIADAAVGKTVVQVSAGRASTCVLTAEHRGRCWGYNGYGQLGRDNTTNVGNDASPGMAGLTDITMGVGDPKITKIEISGTSACALTVNSGLRCWGYGLNGRLGTGATSNVGNSAGNTIANLVDIDMEAPADTVDSADQVVTDFANFNHMVCATNAAGKIKCWGKNDVGQLGLGNTTATNTGTPADYSWMDFGSKVVQFSGEHYNGTTGRHICVITESDEIYCWGAGDKGQLGYSETSNIGDDELATDLPPVSL